MKKEHRRADHTRPGHRGGRKGGRGRILLGPDGAAFRPVYSAVGAACPNAADAAPFPTIQTDGFGEMVYDGGICANPVTGTVRAECDKPTSWQTACCTNKHQCC